MLKIARFIRICCPHLRVSKVLLKPHLRSSRLDSERVEPRLKRQQVNHIYGRLAAYRESWLLRDMPMSPACLCIKDTAGIMLLLGRKSNYVGHLTTRALIHTNLFIRPLFQTDTYPTHNLTPKHRFYCFPR